MCASRKAIIDSQNPERLQLEVLERRIAEGLLVQVLREMPFREITAIFGGTVPTLERRDLEDGKLKCCGCVVVAADVEIGAGRVVVAQRISERSFKLVAEHSFTVIISREIDKLGFALSR